MSTISKTHQISCDLTPGSSLTVTCRKGEPSSFTWSRTKNFTTQTVANCSATKGELGELLALLEQPDQGETSFGASDSGPQQRTYRAVREGSPATAAQRVLFRYAGDDGDGILLINQHKAAELAEFLRGCGFRPRTKCGKAAVQPRFGL